MTFFPQRTLCPPRFSLVLLLLATSPILVNRPAFSQEAKAPVTSRRPVDFSAFAQIRYTDYSSGGADTFSLRRVRLIFAASVLEDLDFKVQLEQTKSVSLVEAFFDLHVGRWGRLRAGQFKVPFSRENLRSASELDLINRSTVVETLCPGRDIGAQGRDIGAMFILQSSRIEAAVGLFNGSGINRTDADSHKDRAFRLVLSPLKGLSIGGSWYEGLWPASLDSSSRVRQRKGLEAQLRSGALGLAAEYIFARDYDLEASGWFAQASLFLRQGIIQPIVRFESLDRNRSFKNDEEEVLTLGLNIHFAPRTKLQLNQESHRPRGGSPRRNVFLAQFQVGF